jgi:hypothetical protein
MKCDEDYILVTDEAWDYLFKIYNGTDLPRYSIEVSSAEPGESEATQMATDKEYIVEVFFKQVKIYILPRNTSHLVLRKPSAVFVRRKAKVADLHRKIAEILHPN